MKTNRKNCKIIMLIIVIVLMLTTIVACNSGEELRFYELKYSSTEGGTVHGNNVQKVKTGSSGKKVVAVANEGYQFESWSDGSLSKERIDQVSNSDLTVCATFKKIGVKVKYQAYGGGYIEGETEQNIQYGKDSGLVTAIPFIGYKFENWSDGETTTTRQEHSLKSDIEINAFFSIKVEFNIAFVTDSGGVIEGEKNQKVEIGKDSLYVTAVADENFEFFEWSDGEKNATRNIKNVQSYVDVTAIFKRITQNFSYVYNGATSDANIENDTISFKDNIIPKFAIPKRNGYKFVGGYLEWHLTTIVSDPQGVLLIGEEFFDKNFDSFYAKWVAQDAPHCKILMVNITSVQADFITYDGEIVPVDYRQTEAEKLIHKQTSTFLSD